MDHVMRCNVCDKVLEYSQIEMHVGSRAHSIMKKVAEYNEMNALIGRQYFEDASVTKIWIRDLIKRESVPSHA